MRLSIWGLREDGSWGGGVRCLDLGRADLKVKLAGFPNELDVVKREKEE